MDEDEIEGWVQPSTSHADEQLDELARLRDVMPGWIRLAKEILEPDKEKSK